MNIEDTVAKLADGQAGQDARLVRLETAFQSVAQSLQMLIEMAAAHEERLDAGDEARIHTDARLDALIDSNIKVDERFDQARAHADARLDALVDSQIKLDERFAAMTDRFDAFVASQAERDRRFDAMVAKWDQMAIVQAEHSTAILALLERNGK